MRNVTNQTVRSIADYFRKNPESINDWYSQYIAEGKTRNSSLNACTYYDLPANLSSKLEHSFEGSKLLFGVPFTAKDHIPVKDLPRSDGTKLGAVERAETSSLAIKLLENAGAFCVGKGNQAEYGRSYFTDNDSFGRSLNPFGTDRSPGGSGGGDAAAVAAGMAAFALGSDMSGSVRVPANFCGLFGLCPTPGRIPSEGLQYPPHTVKSLMTSLGPIARTVDCLRIVLTALTAFNRPDQHSELSPTYFDDFPAPASRVLSIRSLCGITPDEEIQKAQCDIEERLKNLGWTVIDEVPDFMLNIQELYVLLSGQIALMADDLFSGQKGIARDVTSEGAAMKGLRERVATELPPLTAQTVLVTWVRLEEFRSKLLGFLKDVPYILSPVSAILPPPYKENPSVFELAGKEFGAESIFHYAALANLGGIPAVAFPTGLSSNGLPVGLQLHSGRYREKELLQVVDSLGVVAPERA